MALAVLLVLANACGRSAESPAPVAATTPSEGVRIGAFNFPESRLVAELYAQALKGAGYAVAPVLELGSREVVEPALEQGRVDVVPEYTGSALAFLEPDVAGPDGVEQTHARLVRAFADRGITVAKAAPAQNKNAFAIARARAEELDVRTLSDLAPVADDLVLGGPPECPQRRTCGAGLRDVYGITFRRFLSLERPAHVAAALESGEIDVGLLFTTDPNVLINNFTVLTDDRDLQPAENVVPVVRDEVVDRHGDGIIQTLDRVSARLTTAQLSRLNLAVGQRPKDTEAIATEWLQRHGITP